MRVAAFLLVSLSLAGQDAYFKETPTSSWLPAWELTLRGDRIDQVESGKRVVDRESARLRLKWAWEEGMWSGALATWSALGSDGNRHNISRYDQQASNGSRLDAAWVQVQGISEAGFLQARIGLQENPLLSQECLWDKDLRLTGASFRAAWRTENLQELGLRATVGRVRTQPNGDVVLAAAQAVARFDTGPLAWSAYAGRWALRWEPSDHRELKVPSGPSALRQELQQDAVGIGVVWQLPLPLEVKASRQRDPNSKAEGAEYQAWIGSRTRVWWPQIGYIWQRFEFQGTLYPVNGDDWWFMTNARGPRYEAALPLPGNWLLVATYLQHRSFAPGTPLIERKLLQLVKRF